MMNRREFLSGSMTLLQSAPRQQLNVLLILVDDWGATDLGCGGSKFYETPNMDRLAASGHAIHTSILGLHGLLAFQSGHSDGQVSRQTPSHRLDCRA